MALSSQLVTLSLLIFLCVGYKFLLTVNFVQNLNGGYDSDYPEDTIARGDIDDYNDDFGANTTTTTTFITKNPDDRESTTTIASVIDNILNGTDGGDTTVKIKMDDTRVVKNASTSIEINIAISTRGETTINDYTVGGGFGTVSKSTTKTAVLDQMINANRTAAAVDGSVTVDVKNLTVTTPATYINITRTRLINFNSTTAAGGRTIGGAELGDPTGKATGNVTEPTPDEDDDKALLDSDLDFLKQSIRKAAKINAITEDEAAKFCPNKIYFPKKKDGIVKIIAGNEEINMSVGTLKYYGFKREVRMKLGRIICLTEDRAEMFLSEFKKQFRFGEKVDEFVYHDASFKKTKGPAMGNVDRIPNIPKDFEKKPLNAMGASVIETVERYLTLHMAITVFGGLLIFGIIKLRSARRKLIKAVNYKPF